MPRARIAWLILLAPAAAGGALAATPTAETVVPAIGPRGGELTLTIAGGRLKGAQELLLYEAGLTCRKVEVVSENEVRATLVASPDCRLGAHPFRVRTPGGLSELKVVHVGPLPVVAEAEPNDEIKDAQAVALNTTVAGVLDSGDIDGVRVALKKGQRLSAEVQAVRLGGEMTDAVLTVIGPDGRPIAEVDDTQATRQDPFASLVAPADGAYTVQVRDSSFGGGPGNTYALHIGDFARPSGVFPPGGQAGHTTRLRLLGSEAVEEVKLPADAGPWWNYYPTLGGRIAPTPTALRVRPYPSIEESDLTETAPADPGSREARDWPVAFHGVIAGRGDVDAFAIRARPGDEIQVEAFAARVGSPLDAVLEVYGPSGEIVARNDDDATHDSRLVFRAEEDGAYRVEIGDKRRDGGPGFFYRVEVEQPRPALTLFLPGPLRRTQARQVIAVPRGNRVAAHIGVRRDGFDAPVQVKAGPLPLGVRMDAKEIAAGSYLTAVVFEAAADAPLGASLVELKGLASTPDGTVQGGFQQVVDLIPGSGDSSYESVTVDRLAVVVTEEAPYQVGLSAPRAALARDGEISLVATVRRAEGFDGPIEVSLPYLPPGVEMEGPAIVPTGQSEAILRLFARPDADPVSWRLAAEARPAPPRRDRREMTLALMNQIGAGGGRRRRPVVEGQPQVASRFVPLDLTGAAVSGRFSPAAAEQGQAVAVSCTLEPGSPLPGKAVASIEGLPPRATAEPVEVAPGAIRVEFRVAVAASTPVGEHDTLICRLAGEIGGQPVVYRVGRVGRLKVSPTGAAATGADGKPLSPLDALRLKERAATKSSTDESRPKAP
jgi:hypothetical protein